jgi:BirA family biotin operon repressor/biotin-[acetyl-CoA-carboxylase] ligase
MSIIDFPKRLKSLLEAGAWGEPLTWYASIGSTNDVALELARQGFGEGTVVGAEVQTRGRGRAGRPWFSPGGTGLWFSVILRPLLRTSCLGRIGLWASVGLADALGSVTDIEPNLSWPNDVMVEDRKLAGILAESSGDADRVDFVVLGLGINVNQVEQDFPGELHGRAASVRELVGHPVDRAELMAALLKHLKASYDRHQRDGFAGVAAEWKAHSGLIGRQVQVRWGTERLTGEAADIGDDGELLLRLPSGALRRIAWGEASVL